MARMAIKDRTGGGRGRRPQTGRRRRRLTMANVQQTQCRFCRESKKYIDYKDIETLQKLLTNRGKIFSRKRSGNCAGCQRKAKTAIKRARFMALLPFTS
jgi:small subunit ribosomal protein S18